MDSLYCISIPLGAIKTIHECQYVCFKSISIPLGAIKTPSGVDRYKVITDISIPLGAIKTLNGVEFLFIDPNFNSTWCD